MKTIESINLTDSVFSSIEARDIIMEMLKSKINFYKLKNLRTQYLHGVEDTDAVAQIKKLKMEQEKFTQLIRSTSHEHQFNIKINVEVSQAMMLHDMAC